MMNLLLNTGNSTGLTGYPSALCVCRGCLMSWPCLRIQWRSLQILWLRLQTKRSGYFKSSRPHRLGADQKTLLCLYRALVRSKLDYGCIVYGVASNNIRKKLDPIHHQGFRIALGAFRTSPVTSLYAKAQEMSLKNRRKKLSMNYVLKLKTCPDNPAYSCVFEPQNSKLFEKSSVAPALGLRILLLFEDSKIDFDTVDDTTASDIPPWSQSEPQICLSLTKYKKRHHKPWIV